MAIWTIIVMIIFIVIIGIFSILTLVTDSENVKRREVTVLYPFSGQLAPPGPPWTVWSTEKPENGLSLTGSVGGKSTDIPQIQCPVGYKVNIVGAFLDVNDPYSVCTDTPDSTYQATCGIESAIKNNINCTDDSTCPTGTNCKSGICSPITCKSNGDCSSIGTACGDNFGSSCTSNSDGTDDCGSGLVCVNSKCSADPGKPSCIACVDDKGEPISGHNTGTCASMPLCMNIDNGLNKTCSPTFGDTYKCRPRDATAYLAEYCDGKSSCLTGSKSSTGADIWNPANPNIFGPLPCQIIASTKEPMYATLPIFPGWGGGAPTTGGTPNDITYSQGYYVHGVYSCIPNDENAVTDYSA